MAKIKYVDKKLGAPKLRLVETANEIIAEYRGQGFDLTLRQLYYQFVARDLIPNTMRSYKNLGGVINDARLAGLVDWAAIVDRTRELRKNAHWESPADIVSACAKQFQIDKWADQEYRVEVWIEKDALVGVIEGVCRRLDVPFFSCRGYTSQSEMHEAAKRLEAWHDDHEQKIVIVHLGDHDPSGKDMSRDIQDRMDLFNGHDMVTVERIALNTDQVRKYRPPPNPAKLTDPRCAGYIKEHGSKSWELDALDPKVISALITAAVDRYRDKAKFRTLQALEQEHRDALETAAESL